MNEYDDEPVRGLPGRLPEGESILWQGAPDWRSLARNAFHLRPIAGYFALLVLWSAALHAHAGGLAGFLPTLWLLPLAASALGLLAAIAWLTARTTIYTITNRRIVLRFGIALPICINLPYAMIDSAGLRTYANGCGDLPLALKPGQKISYLVLWPHARPWRVSRPEPMLRSIPEVDRVAQLLGRALSATAEQAVAAAPQRPSRSSSGLDSQAATMTA